MKKDNLTLRFRLFAGAWLWGAINCILPPVFYRKDVRTISIVVGVALLLMSFFTWKKSKISYYLASGVMGIQVVTMGMSIAMLGNLLMYEPFIWPFVIDVLFLLLFVLFSTNSEIKQALNLKPKLLKRKESIKIIVTASLGIVFTWMAIWVGGILIEKKYDIAAPHVDAIVLKSNNVRKTENLVSRHFILDSVPIPRESLLKMIWQGKDLTDPARRFSVFAISKDDYIIGLKRGANTGLLLSAKTMAQFCGKVGPYRSTYDWAVWIATDRTAFLSRFFRGMSAMFSSGGMIKIRLLKTQDYLGIVEEGASAKDLTISVDMIGRDCGNIINLRVVSQKRSPEQLWELVKPILTGMKPDITVGKIQHILALIKEGKSSPQKPKKHSFGKLLEEMDGWNIKSSEEWMKEAEAAFKEERYEDCKWALVQPILDNYEGGAPYVLFGRTLMKQGYPDPAGFFYRKAEFWMKDDSALKALEAAAEHELDKQDPTGERFKPNPKVEKILREAKELLNHTGEKQ